MIILPISFVVTAPTIRVLSGTLIVISSFFFFTMILLTVMTFPIVTITRVPLIWSFFLFVVSWSTLIPNSLVCWLLIALLRQWFSFMFFQLRNVLINQWSLVSRLAATAGNCTLSTTASTFLRLPAEGARRRFYCLKKLLLVHWKSMNWRFITVALYSDSRALFVFLYFFE
jgi:hypothetical protein